MCRKHTDMNKTIIFILSVLLSLSSLFAQERSVSGTVQDDIGDLLPGAIWRRPKMGFGVPLDHWFRHELKELAHDVLLGDSAQSSDFFRREAVETLLREHVQRTFDHSYRLWALLVFELWRQTWCQQPAPSVSTRC